MAVQKKYSSSTVLGRGLDEIGNGRGLDALIDTTDIATQGSSNLNEIALSQIEPNPDQPRREFDEEALQELADSIKTLGIIAPITLRQVSADRYQIIAGERRWRASKIAGLDKIPAIVRTLDSQHRLELSIIENAQREDLNAIELATAYAKLKTQFNLSDEDIAAKIGKSEQTIRNTLRLLTLPDDVKKTMVKEKLTEGVMRPLVSRDEKTIKKVLPKIIKEGWTARKVERYFAETTKKSSARAMKRDAYRKDEDKLTAKYNVVTKITGRSLTFKCKNETKLKELIDKFLAY